MYFYPPWVLGRAPYVTIPSPDSVGTSLYFCPLFSLSSKIYKTLSLSYTDKIFFLIYKEI